MDTALYKILQVPFKAKFSVIKAAYRRRAAKTHPDVGGDAEEFMRVREAWEVLGHGERRREYDRTGRWSKVIVVNSRQMLHNFMANLFNVVIDQGVAFDRTAPLIDLMKRACKENGDKFAEAMKKAKGFVESLEDLDERITRKGDGDNVFSKMLDERLRGAKSRLKEHEVNFEAARDCFKELDLYESVDEVVRTMQTFRVFTTGDSDAGTTTI